MKKMLFSAVAFAVVAVSAVAVAPTTSEAIPAFARQTGAACLNCHFQAIPRLTAFGRNFKIGGFRDMGEQALLEDDALSLPATFNASLLFKARIQSSNKAGPFGTTGNNVAVGGNTSKSAIQWPDEAALLIGGRYGSNIGGLTEWNGGPLSYKLAIVGDFDFGQVGFVGGSTDALGTGYLFNDPSNVLVRNTRGSQFRPGYFKATSMQTGVSGLGLYATVNDLVYVALGQFVSNGGNNPANGGAVISGAALDFLTWGRIAVTTELAGLDTVVGFYSISGTQEDNNAVGIHSENTNGVDIQMQGDLGDTSVGFYGNYQFSGKVKATPVAAESNATGYYVLGTVGFGHAGVRAGYSSYDATSAGAAAVAAVVAAPGVPAAAAIPAVAAGTKLNTKTVVVGAWYSLAQNVELDLEYEGNSGASTAKTTTLLLEYVY